MSILSAELSDGSTFSVLAAELSDLNCPAIEATHGVKQTLV